jgi:hypothetical protein
LGAGPGFWLAALVLLLQIAAPDDTIAKIPSSTMYRTWMAGKAEGKQLFQWQQRPDWSEWRQKDNSARAPACVFRVALASQTWICNVMRCVTWWRVGVDSLLFFKFD